VYCCYGMCVMMFVCVVAGVCVCARTDDVCVFAGVLGVLGGVVCS